MILGTITKGHLSQIEITTLSSVAVLFKIAELLQLQMLT